VDTSACSSIDDQLTAVCQPDDSLAQQPRMSHRSQSPTVLTNETVEPLFGGKNYCYVTRRCTDSQFERTVGHDPVVRINTPCLHRTRIEGHRNR
jgi:hypothetical protein